MNTSEKSYVYGPVASRRLGRSLGLDLVPHKVCSYNCPYCQIAETTNLTLERGVFAPIPTVLSQIRARLEKGPAPDWITLAGSGEPTLCLGLGDLIAGIRALTDIPTCLITNGSLLWMPELQEELKDLRLIVPSLDAGSAATWQAINRPAGGLTFERMTQGLIDFRRGFKGEYRLEIFLLKDVNDSDAEMRLLADWARRIDPDGIDINTAVRPTAVRTAVAVPRETMVRFASMIGPKASIIAHVEDKAASSGTVDDALMLESIARHPATEGDLAKGFGVSREAVRESLMRLEAKGLVRGQERGAHVFYEKV